MRAWVEVLEGGLSLRGLREAWRGNKGAWGLWVEGALEVLEVRGLRELRGKGAGGGWLEGAWVEGPGGA